MLYGPGDVELCAWGPVDEQAEEVSPRDQPAPVPADWLQRVPRLRAAGPVPRVPVQALAGSRPRVERSVMLAA